MTLIQRVTAREILDSKGHPTIEAEVLLEDGTVAVGAVPSGASTGATEALELRDEDKSRYLGKGVLKAVQNVEERIAPLLQGKNAYKQEEIDRLMVEEDGSEDKSVLGANAILSVSMAVCRAAAKSQDIPLYEYFGALSKNTEFALPRPHVLLIEGGKHGNWATDIQEYMITPTPGAFGSFSETLRVCTEVYHSLGKILEESNFSTGVGFEGAFAPRELSSNEEVFELIINAVEMAGFVPGEQLVLSIDAASSEFFEDGSYVLKSEGEKRFSSEEWAERLKIWTEKYPLFSLEDPFSQEDWKAWSSFLSIVGDESQLVGDDLLTTNTRRIKKAVDLEAVNAVLIKLNQIGTVTETLEAVDLSHNEGFETIVSHRGGETNDNMIADLVVGSASSQCKFGAPTRGERVAKYNRLLRIEERLEASS